MKSSLVLSAMLGAVAAIVVIEPAMAQQKQCPEVEPVLAGTVEGKMWAAGLIIGARWGEGTLTLKDGTVRKFDTSGAKLLDLGVAEMEYTGNVYNLNRIEDFTGDYSAVSEGLTLVKGLTGSALLTNKKCVYIELDAKSAGIKISAPAPGGIQIDFAEE